MLQQVQLERLGGFAPQAGSACGWTRPSLPLPLAPSLPPLPTQGSVKSCNLQFSKFRLALQQLPDFRSSPGSAPPPRPAPSKTSAAPYTTRAQRAQAGHRSAGHVPCLLAVVSMWVASRLGLLAAVVLEGWGGMWGGLSGTCPRGAQCPRTGRGNACSTTVGGCAGASRVSARTNKRLASCLPQSPQS